MPTVTETEGLTAFAHCVFPRCPGNAQQEVKAVRRETAHSYRERGGDGPGIESSWVTFAFADPTEQPCPHCGKAREIGEQRRRSYAPLSGHDPLGLLQASRFDPGKQAEIRSEIAARGDDPEKVALEQQVEALTKALADRDDDALG